MTALVDWLGRNADGVFWGTYRCEKWGPRSASLHAEGRAVDWHAGRRRRPPQRREAERLIAPASSPRTASAQPQALARRMGVEEIIWDCGYWGAGMGQVRPYSARACPSAASCAARSTRPIAHRNHLHIGLTKAGAAKRTSFWTRSAARGLRVAR